MTVTPLHPNVRYYCSDCDVHYHEHEREKHKDCCPHTFCTGCGRAFSPGDGDCPECGTPQPTGTLLDKLRIVSLSANGHTELAIACIAEIERLQRRLADCERSLRAFDTHGSSEYWVRYPTETTEGREASPNQLYLIRKSAAPGRPAHIWTGSDTQCRMASTGGLSMRKYTVVDQLEGRPICQNCINVGASLA